MACDRYKKWVMGRAIAVPAAAKLAEVDAHVRECASCRELLDQERTRLEAIERSLVRSLSAAPSPGFEASLRGRLAEEMASPGRTWFLRALLTAGAIAAAFVLTFHPIRSFKHRASGRAVATIDRFGPTSAGSDSRNVDRAGPSRKFKIRNSRLQKPTVRKALAVVRRPRREPRHSMHGAGPDLRVVVEPGQWTAVVQLYEAVRTGRVNEAALLAKTAGPIKIKPIEISELKIAPLERARSDHGPSGGGVRPKTDGLVKASL
jgi:hypothetical protein